MSDGVAGPPDLVAAAQRRAERLGFAMSVEPVVGALLATFAAAVPTGGRIVELGTGAGVGLAWLVHGVGARHDVGVVTVDVDDVLQQQVRADGWPPFVRFVHGDGAVAVRELGPSHLVFADAPGGKLERLDATIGALAPRGVLVVDDMDPALHVDDGLGGAIAGVRECLVTHPDLVVADLAFGSGVVVATRRDGS